MHIQTNILVSHRAFPPLWVQSLQATPNYHREGAPFHIASGDDLGALQELELRSADGVRINGWYWPGVRPENVLMLHGNAGHRGHRLDWARGFHELGFGVLLLDYRGYGGSDGSPTEEGLYLDAEAAVAWLRRRPGGMIYLGESLGSGPAIELALRHPPAALILHAPLASAVDVGRAAYPYLPVSWLLKDRYENDRKIGKVASPILVIHGERDSVVPLEQGRRLFDLSPGPKEWLSVPKAGHNDLAYTGGERYWSAIRAFLEKSVIRPASARN
ncbi:MAG: alpha/beta hydrolase [Acidimicrobiia bacterium]|nr:alpha/beta hydrolase [Acidimicrobiia bacterium]